MQVRSVMITPMREAGRADQRYRVHHGAAPRASPLRIAALSDLAGEVRRAATPARSTAENGRPVGVLPIQRASRRTRIRRTPETAVASGLRRHNRWREPVGVRVVSIEGGGTGLADEFPDGRECFRCGGEPAGVGEGIHADAGARTAHRHTAGGADTDSRPGSVLTGAVETFHVEYVHSLSRMIIGCVPATGRTYPPRPRRMNPVPHTDC